MKRGLFFDCDGVLADTERDGHLVAFNEMWRREGVNWQWTLDQYAEKLLIGGGKERLASLARDDAFRAVYDVPESEAEWLRIVARWHEIKTALYRELVASGAIAPRPGVKRLAEEALARGWVLAVCSTSAHASVEAVLNSVMGDQLARRFAGIFAGDIVKAKKPAPDIYVEAAKHLRLDPSDCVVIEDSRNGLLAAVAAGMTCIITCNDLTRHEDFSEAALVLSSLGEPNSVPMTVLRNPSALPLQDHFNVDNLEEVWATNRRSRQ